MQAAERAEKCRFLTLVTLTFAFKLIRGSKHIFRVNLAQIRSAVPEIFHTQTKKHRLMVPKNRTFRSSTRANPVWIQGLFKEGTTLSRYARSPAPVPITILVITIKVSICCHNSRQLTYRSSGSPSTCSVARLPETRGGRLNGVVGRSSSICSSR